jgi:hypothetical protein
VLAVGQIPEGGTHHAYHDEGQHPGRTAAAAIFAAGFLAGSISQRPGRGAARRPQGQGHGRRRRAGRAWSAPPRSSGRSSPDMKKNLDGLQKNYDMLKKVQALLGG